MTHYWCRPLRLKFDGSEDLVVADCYSRYPFVRRIPRGQSYGYKVVELMKQVFSEQGIPRVLRSDNGPHFSGQAFQDFAQKLGFQHTTSSPHYPRSNGFIESQVKSVKSTILKSKLAMTDSDMSLLCLRAIPVEHKLPSPTELLLGRAIQDNLPRKIPREPSSEEVTSRLTERQQLQKYYHDRSDVKQLPELTPGERVTIQDPATLKWKPAEVKEGLV